MPIKIGILSKNHQCYAQLLHTKLKQQPIVKYKNIISKSEPSEFLNSDVNVLLADPNLAADVITSLNNLEWIQSTWAGVNRLIFHDKKNYRLTGLKNIFGQKMSEFVFAYLLYLTRHIDGYKRLQQNRLWEPISNSTLNGKTIGIMGMGNIGEHIAKHAKMFGMTVCSVSRRSKSKFADQYFSLSDLNQFASVSDVVVNLLPETPDTIGLCDQRFFLSMKKDAIFFNVGRGSIIEDELVLDNILQSGHLRAAILDVCKHEPLPQSHPFWSNKSVFLTNHTAAISDENEVFDIFWDNLQHFVLNQELKCEVDFNRGY